jgi:hypothetical protein
MKIKANFSQKVEINPLDVIEKLIEKLIGYKLGRRKR